MTFTMSRKQFLTGAAAATALAARPARAANHYVMKFGIDLPPDHPTTKGVVAAGEAIKSKSDGAVEVQVFPNNQLGDDTHMLVQSALRRDADDGDRRQHPCHPGADRRDRQYRLRLQGRPRRPGPRWTARSATWSAPDIAKAGLHAMHQHLGRGLPPDHLQHQADQHA